MKKSALVLAVLTLAGLACIPRSKDETLRVSLFTDVDTLNIMRDHLVEFEAESGIKVESVYIPYASYGTKLLTQIAAGEAPDVIWVDVALFPGLQANGAFEPLNPYLAKDPIDLKQFYPGVLNRFTQDGTLYAVPQDTAPIACLYYNKKQFREAGLSYPKDNWSWDDFVKVSKKLVKKDAEGKTTRWAFMDNYGPDYASIIFSNGGKFVDKTEKPTRCLLNSPECVQAIQFMADTMNKYGISPPMAARANNMLSLGQDEFITGRVSMMRCGIWVTPALRNIKDFDWDMVPFPSGPRAKNHRGGWSTGGSGYSIATGSRHRDNAWKLIKYLASAKSQMAYAKLGFVQPAIMSLAASDVFLKSAPPANKAFLLDAVDRSYYPPYHPQWGEAEASIISNTLTEVWLGKKKAKPAMDEITQKVNALLFTTKKKS